MGVPCVANTRTGTRSLGTGDVVRVDGGSGEVVVLERASHDVWVIAFWIPLSVSGAWWFVTAYVLLRGLKIHERDRPAAGPVSPATSV